MNKSSTQSAPIKTALVLPGGGARAAYQVGVLKAIAQHQSEHTENTESPFPILCGTSAGAINTFALASREQSFTEACIWLEDLWENLETDFVYRSGWIAMARNIGRLLMSLVNSGIAIGRPVALLDNVPLKQFLGNKIDFSGIGRNISSGALDALCVTAMNYTEGTSVSFFQGGPENAGWQRWRRQGIPTPLQLRHLLASTAIPTIFPPQRIGRNYYGDGALRQLAPISPALHLGAEKVMVISTTGHKRSYTKPHSRIHSPAFGQIIGQLLNSAFVDSLESDIELLEQMNELLVELPKEHTNSNGRVLKPIDILVISPSQDIDGIAFDYASSLPRSIRTLLRISGGSDDSGGLNLSSYLLFTRSFCQRLIALGYRDGRDQMDEIQQFLQA